MSKHTPGPWKVTNKRGGPGAITRFSIETAEADKWERKYIAKVDVHQGAEANACLIAAAPTMLAVLKQIAPRICKETCDQTTEWHSDECDAVREAISKAEAL